MHVNVNTLVAGQKYQGVYILLSHAKKTTKTGKDYLDISLSDKTGNIPAKLWDIPFDLDVDSLVDGDFIVVQFSVDTYMGNNQAIIEKIRKLLPTDQFDKADLVPCAPETGSDMLKELWETINHMENKSIKKLCSSVIMDYNDVLVWIPGAKSMHHDIVGGLLMHTLGMLRMAKAIAGLYPTVNKDLLFGGVILHDIAKIREYKTGPTGLVTDYSLDGALLGHITMGVSYIEQKCHELKIDEETTRCITHMILSHHGEPDWGSAIRPMFLEAFLLSNIDNMDAKIYMYNKIYEGMEAGTLTDKNFGMANPRVYKPNM